MKASVSGTTNPCLSLSLSLSLLPPPFPSSLSRIKKLKINKFFANLSTYHYKEQEKGVCSLPHTPHLTFQEKLPQGFPTCRDPQIFTFWCI